MDEIRTAIVTVPAIISDVVATLLSARTTLKVVARFDDRAEIAARLSAVSPDLVLIGLRNGETDEIARTLLTDIPAAKVVAFSRDGRNAYVYEVRVHRKVLADVSPRVLINAILRK